MDALDVRIIRALMPTTTMRSDPAALKPAAVAKRAGTTVQTLKERLRNLETSGFIERYMLQPLPATLDRRLSAHIWRVPERAKSKLLPKLERVDGVGGYLDFVGQAINIPLNHRDDMEKARLIRLVSNLLDAEPTEHLWRPDHPIEVELTGLDYRIIANFIPNAKRPVAEVAKEVGVSAKTVQTRRDRLLKGRAAAVLPVIDRESAKGITFARLLVKFDRLASGDDIKHVNAAVADVAINTWSPPANATTILDYEVVVTTMRELNALQAAIEMLGHVESCETLIPRSGYDNIESLRDLFARKLMAANGSTSARSMQSPGSRK